MYEAFFGLREEPFRLTPDPRFFHLAEPHAAALSTLLEAVTRRRGFVLVTGPCGTGKTMLVHATLQILSDRAKTGRPISSAFIFNPTLSGEEFLEMTLAEFAIPCEATSKPARLAALRQMLLERHTRGGTSLLLVDEAHLLTDELLEEIQLMGNADTYQGKLLQIVLCGLPELVTSLSRPESRGLRQKIASSCSLRPLVFEEFEAYVAARLHAAGFRGSSSPFPRRVRKEIFRRSEGIPRLINLFCDACLTIGCQGQRPLIDFAVVEEAAFELGRNEADVVQRPVADRTAEADPVFVPVFDPDTTEAMRPIVVNSSARPFAAEEVNLNSQEPPCVAPAATFPEFIAVESAAIEAGSPAEVPECEAISTGTDGSNVSVFLKDLNPVPLALEQNHKERALHLGLTAGSSGPADPLIIERKPNPATVLSAASRSFAGSSRTENATSSTVPSQGIPPPARKRAFTREVMNQLRVNSRLTSIHTLLISLRGESLLWVDCFLLSISLARRRCGSFAVFRRIGQSAFLTRLSLRRWWFDFKPDWSAVIEGMALAKMKISFLRPLRQPTPSKMKSSSWRSGSRLWVNRFLHSISLAKWRRVSIAALRRIGQSASLIRLSLGRWWFDFKPDWSAAIDAMPLPKMESFVRLPRDRRATFLQWLHQPIRPKMKSSFVRWLHQPIRPKI